MDPGRRGRYRGVSRHERIGCGLGGGGNDNQQSAAENAANVKKVIEERNNIKYVVLDKGTVWPEGLTGGMEHMQTWKVAYNIEGVRDWLFAQKK